MDGSGFLGENTPMSIAGHFDPKAINLRLQSQTRDDALRELVCMIPELLGKAPEQLALWQALADREKLHTTAVGEGLAFPHSRNAMGNLLKKPVIVFGRHEKGLPWGAVDQKPVHLIFMLAAPSLTEHLHLLGQMSRILRNARTREDLLRAGDAASTIEIVKAAEAKL